MKVLSRCQVLSDIKMVPGYEKDWETNQPCTTSYYLKKGMDLCVKNKKYNTYFDKVDFEKFTKNGIEKVGEQVERYKKDAEDKQEELDSLKDKLAICEEALQRKKDLLEYYSDLKQNEVTDFENFKNGKNGWPKFKDLLEQIQQFK